MENNKSLRHGFILSCSLVLMLVMCLSVFAQTPTSITADNEALLEKLDNIPLRLQNRMSDKQAERVAKVWLHLCPDLNPDDFIIAGAEPVFDAAHTRPVAYVVHVQPRGFIILAADNEIRPIVGYSSTHHFRMGESCDHAGFSMVQTGLSLHLAALEEGLVRSDKIAHARHLWQDYLAQVDANGDVVNGGDNNTFNSWDVEVGPLVTSTWNQGLVYDDPVWNYYTPPNQAGHVDNYVCGCVATAMGQILNYYEWPTTGTGSYTYTWDNGEDPAEELSADFGATMYDWSNTLDNYYQTTTLAQRQNAGLLVYQCGVSVDMNYASLGSGSYTSDVANALPSYFRTSAHWRQNDGPAFYDDLYSTIMNERPGEISIGGECGGHAIVCDGVRHNNGGTKYYHLNMGWGGYDDGWYDIATDFIAGGCTWDDIRGCVIQIIPAPDLDDPGTTIGETTFPVSWQVAALDDADKYELQQSYFASTVSTLFDGAEAGLENWAVSMTDFWSQSNYFTKSGSYAFQGKILKDGVWHTTSRMTFINSIKLDTNSTISYSWGTYYAYTPHLYFEISADGSTWDQLRSHQDTNTSMTWYDEMITSAELSEYAGQAVQVRFTMDGSSTYDFDEAGFYVDDFTINDCIVSDDWHTVDDNLSSTSTSVTVSQDGEYPYRVRAFADGAWRDWSNIESIKIMQPPSTQATDVSCTKPTSDELYVTWSRGNGDGCTVFMRKGDTGDAAPVDNVQYTANSSFGDGDQIGSSGWFCVYDGTDTEVTVTNLSEANYRIHVCEYNLGSIIYNSNSSTGNPANAEGPIDVELKSLTALYIDGHIHLEWSTVSEINVAGFNILRSDRANGTFTRINDTLIRAEGGAAAGESYRFVDASELDTERWYKLETINLDGSGELSDPVCMSVSALVAQSLIPAEFALHQNYPNPFNPHTNIRFDLPAPSHVIVSIHDVQGRLIRTLVNGNHTAGVHTLLWDGVNTSGQLVTSGLYLYHIHAGEFEQVKKMTFLK